MSKNRLAVVAVEKKEVGPRKENRKTKRHEAQARLERMWLRKIGQFDPLRTCAERERIDRTWKMIEALGPLEGKLVADLGCGMGILSRKLRDAGAVVHAVDIAGNALKHVQGEENIKPMQDFIPRTLLEDYTYDIVICTDVISYLHPEEHRLFFSELSRLIKKDGFVVCSTLLDIHSEEAFHRFASLAETEFEIQKWTLSYHRLHIVLRDFFEAPGRFVKAKNDPDYRQESLGKRYGLSRLWFVGNSTPLPCLLWSLVHFISKPIASFLRNSRPIMLITENITRTLNAEAGISHAIFVGARKPLVMKK